MTFEPDHGGWNNIRMAMEVVLVFAFATGRTLVMPPEQGMYLLNKGASADDNKLHFSDFFYLHRLQETMELVEMDKFLEREGVTGNLGELPPRNATDLGGRELWSYLDKVSGGGMRWNPFKVRASSSLFSACLPGVSVMGDRWGDTCIAPCSIHRWRIVVHVLTHDATQTRHKPGVRDLPREARHGRGGAQRGAAGRPQVVLREPEARLLRRGAAEPQGHPLRLGPRTFARVGGVGWSRDTQQTPHRPC